MKDRGRPQNKASNALPDYCARCLWCQRARDATGSDPVPITVSSVQLRPWEYVHYGQKISSVVDWYDGWNVGVHASEQDAVVPEQIIDKRAWVSGFLEGWRDSEQVRNWLARIDA